MLYINHQGREAHTAKTIRRRNAMSAHSSARRQNVIAAAKKTRNPKKRRLPTMGGCLLFPHVTAQPRTARGQTDLRFRSYFVRST